MRTEQQIYNHEYYLNHRDAIKKRSRQWTIKNRDRYRELVRIRDARIRKAGGFREKDAKYREQTRSRCAKWRRENPDKHCAVQGRRRAMQRVVTIGDSIGIAKVYDRARWWRQWFDVVVDHIIPLSKGGSHEASNLQIIYRFENARKGTRTDYNPMVIFTGGT